MRQSLYDSVCFKVCTGLAASKSVRYCLRQSLCDSCYVKVCTILPASKFVRFCLSQSITILAASMLLTSKSVLFSLCHSQTAELSATRSHIDRRTPFGRDTAGSLRLHSFAQWLHSLDEATPGPPCLTVTGTHRLTESTADHSRTFPTYTGADHRVPRFPPHSSLEFWLPGMWRRRQKSVYCTRVAWS